MKYTLLLSLLLIALVSKSQIFWTENFNNGCSQGCTTYTGGNGAWAFVSTGTNDASANVFYVSCAENGHTNGICGTGCAAQSPTATLATLHIGATTDGGASYNSGGLCAPPFNICVQSNWRAESPIINCTGHSSITLKFDYIEGGDGTTDNATVWYYDGSSWSQLTDPPKSILCGNQGTWAAYSIALPASANNNANVKIGFNWTNNDDATGTDPSFAVDSVTLSTVAAGSAPVAAFTVGPNDTVCLGQCLSFTDASTNTPTGWTWSFPGATPSSSAVQNPSFVCYTAAGTYTVTLNASNTSGSDTETHVIVVHPLPHPHLTYVGHVITCTGGPFTAYQWYKSGTLLPGSVAATYTATANGYFYAKVTDANGCVGNSDTVTFSDLAVQNINAQESNVTLYPNPNKGTFTLNGTLGAFDNTAWIEITDITGRVVMQDKIQVHGGIINKQVTLEKGIATGMYMLKLSTSSNRYVLPFRKD